MGTIRIKPSSKCALMPLSACVFVSTHEHMQKWAYSWNGKASPIICLPWTRFELIKFNPTAVVQAFIFLSIGISMSSCVALKCTRTTIYASLRNCVFVLVHNEVLPIYCCRPYVCIICFVLCQWHVWKRTRGPSRTVAVQHFV